MWGLTSSRLETLKAARQEHWRKAMAIAEQALAEGRDVTGDEKAALEMHRAEIKRLDQQIKSEEGDNELRRVVAEMGAGLEQGRPTDPNARARGMGQWGKTFEAELRKRAPFGSKDLLSPSGAVSVPGILSTLAPLSDLTRVSSFLQLIPLTQIGQTDAVSYLRETERTHAAAAVAAGRPKPTSTYKLEKVDDRVRVVAHLTEPITRSWLEDIGLLRTYVDSVLREGVALALEDLAINGTGADEEWTGFLNTSGHQLQPFDTDLLTTTRKAITLLEVAHTPTVGAGFVFSPADWETIELTRDAQDRFQLVNGQQAAPPVDRARRRLWGLPVAVSTAMPERVGLLIDFAGSTKQWSRETTRVDWSEAFVYPADAYDEEASSGFQRNLIRFRAECRHLVACLRPAGVVEISLTGGS